jgi:hypothetical protein
MDPDVRTALLIGGLLFVAAFGGMTLYVVAKSGFDTYGDLLLALFSLGVVVMVLLGLIGAIRNPPKR